MKLKPDNFCHHIKDPVLFILILGTVKICSNLMLFVRILQKKGGH